MIYCNPGPGKHLCSYAMIKSKLNLVLLGESPKSISTGTPGNQILGQKKNKMRAPLFSFLHDTPLSGSKKVGELFFYFCFSNSGNEWGKWDGSLLRISFKLIIAFCDVNQVLLLILKYRRHAGLEVI